MILFAYSFFDKKGGMYSPPFFLHSDGLAARAAQDLVQDLGTTIGRHPSDFDLVQLGSWNDQTCFFEPSQLRILGNCVSFLPQQKDLPFNG